MVAFYLMFSMDLITPRLRRETGDEQAFISSGVSGDLAVIRFLLVLLPVEGINVAKTVAGDFYILLFFFSPGYVSRLYVANRLLD